MLTCGWLSVECIATREGQVSWDGLLLLTLLMTMTTVKLTSLVADLSTATAFTVGIILSHN